MLCVYGVVDAQHPGVERNGVQGEQTRTLRVDDLGAIVSDVGGDELLARRRDVEAHMSVLEAAHADGTVLPFRFGTVVEDDDAMRVVIRQSAPQYRSLLDRIRGRTQMTLKAVR